MRETRVEQDEIVEVVGRWAHLRSGDHVTAIPPFHKFGYDAVAFDRAIARFHRDPAGVLNEGIVQRLHGKRRS